MSSGGVSRVFHFENEETGMRSSGLPALTKVLCDNKSLREVIRGIPDAVVSKISSAHNVQVYNTEQFGHQRRDISLRTLTKKTQN